VSTGGAILFGIGKSEFEIRLIAHNFGSRNIPKFQDFVQEKKLSMEENEFKNSISYFSAEAGSYSYCIEIVSSNEEQDIIASSCSGRVSISN